MILTPEEWHFPRLIWGPGLWTGVNPDLSILADNIPQHCLTSGVSVLLSTQE